MTQIKICGITRLDDALYAASLGADYLGLVFVPSSPRYVEPERAAEIVEGLRGGPSFVGVFRDTGIDEVRRIAAIVNFDLVQFHGDESDDDVQAIGMRAIKAVRIRDGLPRLTSAADWLLFDTWDPRRGGGTGRTFDWSILTRYDRTKPFFLAGGLDPDNVEDAIRLVRPDAIDVSSGVESAPGIKDRHKLRALFESVRRA